VEERASLLQGENMLSHEGVVGRGAWRREDLRTSSGQKKMVKEGGIPFMTDEFGGGEEKRPSG